jgi:hypothetical protein
MNDAKIIEQDECFLRLCPYMVGMKEAWFINRIIYVSPAIFQLLTDYDDIKMIDTVASQLKLRSATYAELELLAKNRKDISSVYNTSDAIMHFRMS